MKNTYATIKLQVLPNLLTPSTRKKKVPHSIFETLLSMIFFLCDDGLGMMFVSLKYFFNNAKLPQQQG
jgi:hypothetical protein